VAKGHWIVLCLPRQSEGEHHRGCYRRWTTTRRQGHPKGLKSRIARLKGKFMKSTAAVLAFASAALFAATRKRKPLLSKAVSTSRGILGRAKESQLNASRVAEQTAERYHDVCHHSSMVVGGCTRLAPVSHCLISRSFGVVSARSSRALPAETLPECARERYAS